MKNLEKSIQEKVRETLKGCNPDVTPNICQMLSSEGGYQKVENMVIQFALTNNVSIGAAVGQLESSL